jgi:hypothetical protein
MRESLKGDVESIYGLPDHLHQFEHMVLLVVS